MGSCEQSTYPSVDKRELCSIEGAVEAVKLGVFDQGRTGLSDKADTQRGKKTMDVHVGGPVFWLGLCHSQNRPQSAPAPDRWHYRSRRKRAGRVLTPAVEQRILDTTSRDDYESTGTAHGNRDASVIVSSIKSLEVRRRGPHSNRAQGTCEAQGPITRLLVAGS